MCVWAVIICSVATGCTLPYSTLPKPPFTLSASIPPLHVLNATAADHSNGTGMRAWHRQIWAAGFIVVCEYLVRIYYFVRVHSFSRHAVSLKYIPIRLLRQSNAYDRSCLRHRGAHRPVDDRPRWIQFRLCGIGVGGCRCAQGERAHDQRAGVWARPRLVCAARSFPTGMCHFSASCDYSLYVRLCCALYMARRTHSHGTYCAYE